ncbi:MAG: prepilin-type N-terminal cleavage/methylation domain-containing protein [Pseudomonadota bacterium]
MQSSGPSQGFTLVEVLVGISILSLVLLATVSGLRTLASTQLSLTAVATRNDELRTVGSFLRDALEATTIGSGSGGLSLGGSGSEEAIFELGSGYLLWAARVRIGDGVGGHYVIRVAQEDASLVMRWQRRLPGRELQPWNNVPSRTLVDKLEEFSVSYRRDPGGEWFEEWDRRGAPGWVRMRIRASSRYWPDLIVNVAS